MLVNIVINHLVSSTTGLNILELIQERNYDDKHYDKLINQQCSLIKHIKTHTGEKPNACKCCDEHCGNYLAWQDTRIRSI